MDESQRLRLICEAVRYCQRVADLGMPSSCYTKALREPVFFLWENRYGGKIRAAKYRSTASMGLRFGKREIVYDHAIPFKYLQAELLGLDDVSPDHVRDVLSRLSVPILITRDEDALLNSAGLAHVMPGDWDGSDPLARYTTVGIDVVPNPEHPTEEPETGA